MAKSKYEYVKTFEQTTTLLPNTYIVVRVDGRGFHKFCTKHDFEKPNDRAALDLMNAAAVAVMKELPDISFAYGISDEFSFIFERSSRLFDRRESKIATTVVSTFTAYYLHLWSTFVPSKPLTPPLPSFDGRVVLYPSTQTIRDYMSWRQVDCHINNLYNTTFWALVQRGGMDVTKAEEKLKGTLAADKNEILFSQFGINYNKEPEMYRKGSIIFYDYHQEVPDPAALAVSKNSEVEISKTQKEKERKRRSKAEIVVQHTDITKDDFWEQRPWLLCGDADR
ncbi:hypothetical protein ABVK25_008318 [Lepraria finkii]|uniref:tRNA(His) guanylyltransferase n=1 Tax=Lepraria finkii TaxID=1340010 RepID=A0ABR4B3H8_9LECA